MADMKIYMDVCCLNRPYDDQRHDRINIEADAIMKILKSCNTGEWDLVSSDAIDFELSGMKNSNKLSKVKKLYSVSNMHINFEDEAGKLSSTYQSEGLDVMDSLHLALCVYHKIDVLLTTDDKFLKIAEKLSTNTKVKNPVRWLMEVRNNEN